MGIFQKEDLVEKFRENPVKLIEEKQNIDLNELKKFFSGEILVCDAYIDGMEKWNMKNNIVRKNRVFAVDHHMPLEQFEKKISSVNLAIEFVRKNNPVPKNTAVVINHTDCDSILSSLIMKGILPPDKKFGKAAIAADHTGEKNEIADLLQSLQYERDIEFSLRNLQLLLEKRSLEPKAQELFQSRVNERERISKMVGDGEFKKVGKIIYMEVDKKIDPTLAISSLPGAWIILSFSPLQKDPNRWEVRMRLGSSAPKGLCLNKLSINSFDPSWGCRWNAGSNRRGGGTELSPGKYVAALNKKLP